ncbi:MAG: COG4280 domain-containing protein [Acidimicrobiales bacterium]
MSAGFLILAVFLACAVEAVEALTIVLAVGVTRGWRSTMYGVGVGVAALAVIVGALGPALLLIPLHVLQLIVGGLLLVFGLQWLRKAILRASGHKAKHDEAGIYERQVQEARAAAGAAGQGTDWYSFTLAFKGVLLEGLEVAFIVLTFGSNQGSIPLAVIGAAAAVIVVVSVGVAVRAPLARVPENSLKFAVGVMLTTFGTFWGAEGAGAHWPASDGSILVILAVTATVALGLTRVLRKPRITTDARAGAVAP